MDVQVSDGHPLEGHYWFRRYKGANRELAIIWRHRDSGEMVCRVGPDGAAQMVEDVNAIWLYCAKNRVAKADAQHYREHGIWPGDAPAPIGDNLPPSDDPLENLAREVEAERARVDAWVAEPHEGKTAADLGANWLTNVRALEKRVIAAFDAEKAPVLAESTRIDTRWRGLKALAAQIKKALDDRTQAIGRKEANRLQDIADAKARADAERERKEWEAEQAKKAALAKEHNIAVEQEAPPLFPIVTAAPPVKVAFGGATGSRVGLRRAKATAHITDWPKAAAHYSNNAKLREVVQKLADHDARDGHPFDGMQIIPGD